MANKKRCGGCKGYFNRSEILTVGIQSFCSSECLRRVRESKPKKRKPDIPDGMRKDVKARDRHRCRMCDMLESEHPFGPLRLHHIVYRSEMGKHEMSNLVTLCEYCHLLVHSNKRKYQPILKDMVKIRPAKGTINGMETQAV